MDPNHNGLVSRISAAYSAACAASETFPQKRAAERRQYWFRPAAPPRVIMRPPPSNHPYLVRWTIAACGPLRLHLHAFYHSDPEPLHDHPWWFVSLVLAGQYLEISDRPPHVRRAGSIAFRRSSFRHRVELNHPCITLILTGPRVREWGFHTRLCAWIPWYELATRIHDCS
jgi:hypothetical protein